MAIRMQQRRGTATQWTNANPVLSVGEIGFETDTFKFKVGDGTTAWTSLVYFVDALGVDGKITNAIATEITNRNNAVSTAINDEVTNRNNAISTEAAILTQNLSNAIGTHEADTTNIHGIADTSALATKTYADGSVSTHNSATTSVHGITNTANLVYTSDSRLSDVRTPSDLSVTTGKIADSAVTSAKIADGTIVTGDIADGAITSAKLLDGTIVDGDINASAAIAQSKISGLTTALAAKAPLADPTFTGTVTAATVTISGNLTVGGTTTTVNATNLEVTDPLIYIGTGNSANLSDLGVVGHFNNGTYQHTGLVRDHADGKWKLFSGVTTEPGSSTIDLTSATYDALKTGPVEATNITASGTITASSSGVVFTDGTQVKAGVPSITTINQQSGAYTSVLTDRDKLVEINSASGVTLTIPTNASVAYPVGTSFDILQTGAGQVTIAGTAGVTVNATPGLKLRTQWSSATLFKRATDTWVVYGDLSA
jgi:hypothetical protein